MEPLVTNSFLPVIQAAITPVIMLSGVGALMITLTNRMGRVVDRTRSLAGQLRQAAPTAPDRSLWEEQLDILWRRAKLVRRAVTFAGLSMLLSCLLVMVIFIEAAVGRFGLEIMIVFACSVAFLIASLVAFLHDIWMSLWALRVEVERARAPR